MVAAVLVIVALAGGWGNVAEQLPSMPEVKWPSSAEKTPKKDNKGDSKKADEKKDTKTSRPDAGKLEAEARWEPSAADTTRARTQLDKLTVTARPKAGNGDYRRDQFGRAWADTDGNGCNQRDDVLWRDVDKTEKFTKGTQGRCTHDMLAGTWHDPYRGGTITTTDMKEQKQAQSVQIDHIVPLLIAWKGGADKWTADQRLQFANDLDNLVAVDGPTNASKGASDPAAWKPKKPAQCGYATRYINVKAKYKLPVDKSEKQALADMLHTCPTK